METSTSRRTFLKGAIAGAGAFSALSTLHTITVPAARAALRASGDDPMVLLNQPLPAPELTAAEDAGPEGAQSLPETGFRNQPPRR